MNKLIFIAFLALLPICSFSQKIEVVYDVGNEQISYLENGEEIVTPVLRRGQRVELKVVNFNNYLYEADIEAIHEENKIGTESLPMAENMALNVPGMEDITLGLYQPSDPPIDYSLTTDADPYFESEKENAIYALKKEAQELLEEIEVKKATIQTSSKEMVAYRNWKRFKKNSLQEVENLKYNPHLPPSKIKEFSTTIIERALDTDLDHASLDRVVKNNNSVVRLNDIQSAHQKRVADYKSVVNQLKGTQRELIRLAPNRSDLVTLFLKMEERSNNAANVLDEAEKVSQNLDYLLEDAAEESLHETMQIWYEYEAIKNNTFSTSYHANAEKDQLIFNVALHRKESVANSDIPESIELAPIKIPIYGGFKVNASVGINFGQYFSPVKSYFVRDSIIRVQDGDQFLPIITSNLHFYKQSRRNLSVGGTLGVGLPFGTGTDFQSVNFFVGPSFFFGQSDRIVLNTGVMGGKVRRLSSGLEARDYFDGGSEFLPYHYPYELGYFIGLSFNLTGGNN